MPQSHVGKPTRFWLSFAALIAGLFAILSAFVACGTATYIIQRYEGPPLPSERIAILRINGGQEPTLVSLDDERMGPPLTDKNTRLHIELLPGTYSVTLYDPAQFGRVVTLRFQAQGGQVYRVLMAQALVRGGASQLRPRVFEVDRGSDEPVRDATMDEPIAVPPRSPPPAQPAPEPTTEKPTVDAGAPEAPSTEDASTEPSSLDAGKPSADSGVPAQARPPAGDASAGTPP